MIILGKKQTDRIDSLLSALSPASVRTVLYELSDAQYASFSSSLLPGTHNIAGVRLPILRKIAGRIARLDWRSFLQESWALAHETEGRDVLFEEKMLHGMILGCAKNVELDELFHYCTYHINSLDNWSVCDSFCSSLKTAKKSPLHAEYVANFLKPYFVLPDIPINEFKVRFALVMLISCFLNAENLENIFEQIAKTSHSGYYVKTAKAWLLSMCYVYYPSAAEPVLLSGTKDNRPLNLDEFTWRKAIQKTAESKRCTEEQRKKLSTVLRG